MCGISGIFAYGGGQADRAEARRIALAQARRGPDGSGDYAGAGGRLVLSHRRLSVIDLSAGGDQPLHAAGGRVTIVFNGEIYNYRALRADLEERGHRFASASDTEVIAVLYDAFGPDMVERLRGMFAFALWDHVRGQLVAARDPLGIKPFYYADDGRCLRFASTVKALVAGGGIDDAPEPAGLTGFALLGSVPEPWTTHRAVRALPAGSLLIAREGRVAAPRRWYSLAQVWCAAETEAVRRPVRAQEAAARFRAAVAQSVRAHLVADVPVGALLSAGVDSGAIVGLASEAGATWPRTVTLGFREFAGSTQDEVPLARRVAAHYGVPHTVSMVDAGDFARNWPRLLAAMDQPSIDGVNVWFAARAIRALGLKVALSGLGGDELLGGYSTFRRLPRLMRVARAARLLPGAAAAWRAVCALAGRRLPAKAAAVLSEGVQVPGAWLLLRGIFLPGDVAEAFADPAFVAEGLARLDPLAHVAAAVRPLPRTAFAQVAVLESALYMRNQLLRDADWAGMDHGVEIRTPLADATLVAEVAPLLVPAARFARPPEGKALLAAAPARPLPAEVLARAKTGFGIPVARWARTLAAGAGAEAESPRGRVRAILEAAT